MLNNKRIGNTAYETGKMGATRQRKTRFDR